MLEFDREKFKKLAKENGYTYQNIADILTNSYFIETKEGTIKAWMRRTNPNIPEYERISALADLFGIPSLNLFVDGEKELENNIKHELRLNPEKYKKYFERSVKSETYADILEKLETLDDEKLSALSTIIKGL